MVKMGTVWDRTAEFLSDNIAAILPIALLAFFVPASIEGNFAAATTGAGPGFKLLISVLQILFALVSVWGSLAITAMALDIASERSAANIATRRFLPARGRSRHPTWWRAGLRWARTASTSRSPR